MPSGKEPAADAVPENLPELRDYLLSDPYFVIDDREVMRALLEATAEDQGPNVVDLRGIALVRLEQRLSRLEDTHSAVLAAAYDNLASTNQIHRAVLTALEADGWQGFVDMLGEEFRDVLNVAEVRLCIETDAASDARKGAFLSATGPDVALLEPGGIDRYIGGSPEAPRRNVTLRGIREGSTTVFGGRETGILSEALVRLRFGEDHPPAMLALGSLDADQFVPGLRPDLLQFLGSVIERVIPIWLSG